MSTLAKLVYAVVVLCVLVLLGLTVIGFFSSHWWVAELIVNFRLQYFIGLFSLLVVLAFFKKRFWITVCLLGCLLNGYFVYSYFSPDTSRDFSGPSFDVATFNVSMWSTRWSRVPNFFRSEDPDVVFLTEFTDRWPRYLKTLKVRYPHSIESPARHPFGFALLSRYPISSWTIEHLQPGNAPYLHAKLEVDGQVVEMLGVHFFSPIRERMISLRNRQIEYLTDQVKSTTKPAVLLGDFNITPFSSHYRQMIDQTPFDDKVSVWSFTGTWPSVPAPFRIMIDHCLATEQFVILNRRISSGHGSDHLPLVCEFGLRPNSEGVLPGAD